MLFGGTSAHKIYRFIRKLTYSIGYTVYSKKYLNFARADHFLCATWYYGIYQQLITFDKYLQ